MRDFERQSHALQTDWTNKRDILRNFLQPKTISSSSRYETLLFQRKPNPPCLLPTIPPACQPLLTLNTGFWASRRDARFLRLHRWQLVFTPIAFTAWGRRDGGRRREEMERRRINGQGKDRRADRKTGRRKERWWVHHCLARLWLGTYLWRTWCGCRERERGGKRGFGNHHLGDQRPVCLFRLQPFSSVWTKGIGYWEGGGGLRQAAESKNYFSSLTLLSSYICPDAVSLIINNLLSDSWHACKESTNRIINTLHTHAHRKMEVCKRIMELMKRRSPTKARASQWCDLDLCDSHRPLWPIVSAITSSIPFNLFCPSLSSTHGKIKGFPFLTWKRD